MVVQAGCYFAVVWALGSGFVHVCTTIRGANLSTVQRKNGKHGEKIRKIENISKSCFGHKNRVTVIKTSLVCIDIFISWHIFIKHNRKII